MNVWNIRFYALGLALLHSGLTLQILCHTLYEFRPSYAPQNIFGKSLSQDSL